MYKGNRLIAMAIGFFALITLAVLGCQTRDGSFPTEVDRSIETSATASEILDMIAAVITNPAVGKSAKSQFQTIVKVYPKKPADGQAKAKSLIDFIMKHYQAGKWTDEGGLGTGELTAAIAAYVGLIPESEAAAACIPNVDCEVASFAGASIPGDVITQPFTLIVTRLPDDFAAPPFFPAFYDISTFPAGITFPTSSASGSLTLAASDDDPFAAICALDETEDLGIPEGAVPGGNLFMAHFENGQWVTLPYVEPPVGFIDCVDVSSEIESALWMRPFQFAASLLSPNAAIAGGRGLGGAISSFSPFGAEYTDPLPTTTTASIVEEQTTFFHGDTITFRAVVSPAPEDEANGTVLFLATNPPHGPGAPAEELVGGEAVQQFVCGSTRVPFGSHTAQAFFLGTSGHAGSESNTLEYECLESAGE